MVAGADCGMVFACEERSRLPVLRQAVECSASDWRLGARETLETPRPGSHV